MVPRSGVKHEPGHFAKAPDFVFCSVLESCPGRFPTMVRKAKRDGRGRRFEPNEAGRFLKNRDPGRQFARRRDREETAAEALLHGSRDPALIGQGPIVDSSSEEALRPHRPERIAARGGSAP